MTHLLWPFLVAATLLVTLAAAEAVALRQEYDALQEYCGKSLWINLLSVSTLNLAIAVTLPWCRDCKQILQMIITTVMWFALHIWTAVVSLQSPSIDGCFRDSQYPFLFLMALLENIVFFVVCCLAGLILVVFCCAACIKWCA